MTFSKKLLASSVAAAVMATSAFAPVANAEVSASAGVANMYYWRGLDLGSGDPAVFGDLTFSESGFYATIWGSSGDAGLGQEYDLAIGYGGEAGDFSYDVSIWNYNYPSATDTRYYGMTDPETGLPMVNADGEFEVYSETSDASPDIGDLTEAIVSLGFGPVTATYYHGIQDLEDYWYATLEAAFGDFSVKYGMHEDDLSHIDLSYAYNDNVSLMLGQVVDDVDGAYDSDLKFVVSYSFTIE
jgi:uncharacterized protein (TIGR02001 family)